MLSDASDRGLHYARSRSRFSGCPRIVVQSSSRTSSSICPSAYVASSALKKDGKVELLGRRRGSRWALKK